jgi:Tol biopolymer transport system component
VGDIGAYRNPALSPDGKRIAVTLLDSEDGTSSLWVFDLSNGNRLRLTSDAGRNDYPVWSPDSRNIAFASNRGGHMDLYLTPADNLEGARLLLSSPEDKTPTSWSKDGRFLLYTSVSPKTREDLWVLENPSGSSAERKEHPLLQTPFRESEGRISPDGRWVVYLSDESGLDAVYLRKLSPDGISGDRWQVSRTGDPTDEARWRGDGRALLIRATHVEAVAEVKADGTLAPGAPRRLFETLPTTTPREVSSDGKRYLYAEAEGPNEPGPFTVVLNWPADLTK